MTRDDEPTPDEVAAPLNDLGEDFVLMGGPESMDDGPDAGPTDGTDAGPDADPGHLSTAPSSDGPGQRFARAGLRLLLVASVLFVGECVWMALAGYPFTPARLATLAASMASVALAAELVLGAAYSLAWKLSPRWAPWVFTAFALPLLLAATESLFSGAWIRELPGVTVFQALFVVALVIVTRASVGLYAGLAAPSGVRSRVTSMTALGTVWLVLGWIDATQQVGHYLAAHLLLAAGIVFCVDMLGRVALPRQMTVPVAAGVPCLVIVLAATAFTAFTWRSPEATHLVASTHGLVPKFRTAVVRAIRPAPALARDRARGASAAEEVERAADDQAQRWIVPRDGDEPYRLILDPDTLQPEVGAAWWVPLPATWSARASGPGTESASALVVLEDGVVLGPANAVHRIIREAGGGAHSHWNHGLYFSTSDGSDPRSNGRAYEVVLPTSDAQQTALHERLDEFALRATSGPAMEAIRAQTRHVIVVVIDALRDDHVEARGAAAGATPALDALAAAGLRFETTYAPSDHTGRSMPSLMTGFPLGVTQAAADHELPLTTWLEHLGRVGWRTFHNGSDYVFRKYEHIPLAPAYGASEQGTVDGKAPGLEDEVLSFVARDVERPFAVLTHWSDPHVGRQKDMAAAYRAGVAAADARLGRLVRGLVAAGVWDSTLLVVTSDHGYLLGEDNRYLAGQGAHEAALRVPLVLAVPGLEPAHRRAAHPVSLHGLAPTVLDVLLPRAAALAWSPSWLGDLVAPDPAFAGGSRLVTSSSGTVTMGRLGHDKLVHHAPRDVWVLRDLVADPAEHELAVDAPRERLLRDAMTADRAREGRLVRRLLGGLRGELERQVVDCVLADTVDMSALADVIDRLWELDDATRTFVLQTVFRRNLRAAGVLLDDVRRDGGRFDGGPSSGAGSGGLGGGPTASRRSASGQLGPWTADGQAALVLAAWAGMPAAAADLGASFGLLDSDGRRWLSEALRELPPNTLAGLAPYLLDDLMARAAACPAAGSDDERLLVLSLAALPEVWRGDTPAAVKTLLVERYNAWSAGPAGRSFQTLRHTRFVRRHLLHALRRALLPGDLPLLASLHYDRDTANLLPRMAHDLDSPAARAFLLDLVERWDSPAAAEDEDRIVDAMVPGLRLFDDAAFRREIDARIQARFPRVRSVR